MKKGVKFVWSKECEASFSNLRAILLSQPVLVAPNFNLPFKLAVDACDTGAGAVLLQEDEFQVEHPVAYFSKKFSPAQKNYSTIEKELLALILGLQHFSFYLCPGDGPIVIYSDHNPLRYLSKFREKNQRLTRWSLYLQEFSLEIKHIKGKENVIADFLSRM